MQQSSSKKYSVGKHPNTLANLNYHGGRPLEYGQEKKRRTLTVTDSGWENIQLIAKTSCCNSVSDLLEKLARGQISLSQESA